MGEILMTYIKLEKQNATLPNSGSKLGQERLTDMAVRNNFKNLSGLSQ